MFSLPGSSNAIDSQLCCKWLILLGGLRLRFWMAGLFPYKSIG